MKSIILLVVILISANIESLSAEANDSTSLRKNNTELLLDLFYGMEYDENGYTCTDTVLDTINGLKHIEISEVWYDSSYDAPVEYKASVGIYIDTLISPLIWGKIEQIADSNFIDILSYHDGIDKVLRANTYKTSIVDDFIDKWQVLISNVAKNGNSPDENTDFTEITPLRVCSVIHKIYEDDNWETYIIEFSYSIHGSNGCPSYADYLSFNKHDGRILSTEEVFEFYNKTSIEKEFYKEFSKAKKKNGYKPGNGPNNFTDNWNGISGIAIIQNGFLIYYQPYVAGCGAEGQYNIIINTQDLM